MRQAQRPQPRRLGAHGLGLGEVFAHGLLTLVDPPLLFIEAQARLLGLVLGRRHVVGRGLLGEVQGFVVAGLVRAFHAGMPPGLYR
jgi:hypothetical protein